MNQSKLEVNAWSRHEARENLCERDTINFGATSDFSRKWRELLTQSLRGNTKLKQIQITLDTQMKTALTGLGLVQ